jgi:streptogramin lyase
VDTRRRRTRRSGARAAGLALTLMVGMVTSTPAAVAAEPVMATDKTYTTTEDFALGDQVSTVAEDGTLKLRAGSTFPFIWVALSDRETIAKVDTSTGQILGEYRGISDGALEYATSRTTVALDGSVWVGHRFTSSVAHIGQGTSCVDRNHNGAIDTSTGYGDVRPWPGGEPGVSAPASAAEDECILHAVNTPGNDSRHMSIDAAGDLWVGAYSGGPGFVRINGQTGEFSSGSSSTFGKVSGCGGYGGLIDGNNVLWSSSGSGLLLRYDIAQDTAQCLPIDAYGVAIDPRNGNLWANPFSGNQLFRVSPDGATVTPFPRQLEQSQGLAVGNDGHVWISSSLSCDGDTCPIEHLNAEGGSVGLVPNPEGAGSTGVAVDAAGKIWSANINDSTATRIDPAAGAVGADGVSRIGEVDQVVRFVATGPTAEHPGRPSLPTAKPYNYSDMTGSVLLGSTAPQGTWTVLQDSGSADTSWGAVSWEATTPPGTSLDSAVQVRAADSEAGLGGKDFVAVTDCQPLGEAIRGQYLEVKLTLRSNAEGTASPEVRSVTVRTSDEVQEKGCEAEPTSPPSSGGGGWVVPTQSVSTGATATADQPLVVGVVDPAGGPIVVRLLDGPPASPGPGVVALSPLADITAPPSTVTDPIQVTFRLHESLLRDVDPEDLVVWRNGVAVSRCSAAAVAAVDADPDPCVAQVGRVGEEYVLTVFSTHASEWSFTVPAEVGSAEACPAAAVSPGRFTDVRPDNRHAAAVACAAWWRIAQGTSATTFSPAAATTRGQMASFLVRLLDAAGVSLPPGRDAFVDDEGSTHEASIDRLSAAGIVHGLTADRYGPGQPTSRGQMATLVVGVYERLLGEPLPPAPDAFSDDEGTVHEAAIDKAAATGLTNGVAAGTYRPGGVVQRDQMASFLTRVLERTVTATGAPPRHAG